MSAASVLLIVVWSAACWFGAVGSAIAVPLLSIATIGLWFAIPSVATVLKRPLPNSAWLCVAGFLGVVAIVIYTRETHTEPPSVWVQARPWVYLVLWLFAMATIVTRVRRRNTQRQELP
jgi:hypothetical protein